MSLKKHSDKCSKGLLHNSSIPGMNTCSDGLIKIQNENKSLLEFGMITSSVPMQNQDLKPSQGLNKDLLLEVDSDSCSMKSDSDSMKQSVSSNDLLPA